MTKSEIIESIAALEEALEPQADGPSIAQMFGTIKESKEELKKLKAELADLEKPKSKGKMEEATEEVGEAAEEINEEAKAISDPEVKETIVEAAKDIKKEVKKSEKAAEKANNAAPTKKEIKEMVATTKKIASATTEIKEATKKIEEPEVKKEIKAQVAVLEEKLEEAHKAEEKITAPSAGKKSTVKEEAAEAYSYKRKLSKEALEKLPIVVQEMRYLQLKKDSWVNTISGKKKFTKGHYVTFNQKGYVTNVFAAKSFDEFCKKCKGMEDMVSKATVEKHKAKNERLEEQFKKANAEKRRLRKIAKENGIDYTPGAAASQEASNGGLLSSILNIDLLGSEEEEVRQTSKPKAKPKAKETTAKETTAKETTDKKTTTSEEAASSSKASDKKENSKKSAKSPGKATTKEEIGKKESCNISNYKGDIPAPLTRYLLEEVEAYKGYEGNVKSRRRTAELYKIDRVYRNTKTGQVVVRKMAKSGGLARVLAGDNYKFYSICLDRGTEKLYKGSVSHGERYKGGKWWSLIKVDDIKKMYADKGSFNYCLELGKAAYDAPSGSKEKSDKYREHYLKCGDQKGKAIAREYVEWLNEQVKKEAKEGETIKERWLRVLKKIRNSVKK